MSDVDRGRRREHPLAEGTPNECDIGAERAAFKFVWRARC